MKYVAPNRAWVQKFVSIGQYNDTHEHLKFQHRAENKNKSIAAWSNYPVNKLIFKFWYPMADEHDKHKHLGVSTLINATFSNSKIGLKI